MKSYLRGRDNKVLAMKGMCEEKFVTLKERN
jgi:hypothetical protein